MSKSTKSRRRPNRKRTFDLVQRVLQIQESCSAQPHPDALTIVAMREQYIRIRQVAMDRNRQLTELVATEGINYSADLLGMLHRGVLVLGDENESNVLFDHAIYNYRSNGKNAIQQYVEQSPPAEGSDEALLFQAARNAFHSIFVAVDMITGFGFFARDVFTQDLLLVADINFSQSVQPGNLLASRAVPLDNFAMFPGAALPIVDARILVEIGDYVRRVCAKVKDFRNMPRDRAVLLESFITRTCLQAGSMERIKYADAV